MSIEDYRSRNQMRRFNALLLVLFGLIAVPAMPQQANLRGKFVGAWKLVSIEGNPNGRPPGFIDRPTGMIVYLASGRMAVQIANKSSRKPFAPFTTGAQSATTEEKAAAFDSYAAYYGTYTIDAKAGTITHHLEDSIVPGRRGTDNVRWFEFRGNDRVALIPVEDGKGGVI